MTIRELGIPYASILPIFTEFKPQLISNIRYDRFRTNETTHEFAFLLGHDVVFAGHPGVTYNIAKRFIVEQNQRVDPLRQLSFEEEIQFLTAAIVHDLGEIKLEDIGVGDVSFEEKNPHHEETERSVFERIIQLVRIDGDREFINTSYQDIALNRTTKLGRMFNAVERIGYLNTAIRCYRGIDGKRITNWQGLVGNVLSNQIEALLEYATEYPYIQSVLQNNSAFITQALSEIKDKPIPNDRQEKPSYSQEKLAVAGKMWLHSIYA